MFDKLYKFSLLMLLGMFFTIPALNSATPTLLLPLDDESCVSKDATFEWTMVSGITYYKLQIATDIDFEEADLVVDTTGIAPGDTAVSKKIPNYGTQYYWRVLAHITGQTDEWSDSFTFHTKKAPPVLTAPTDGLACQDLLQTFEWNPLQSGIDYTLQISTKPNFSSVVIDTTLNGTSVEYKLPEYYTDYYWRVKARYPGCTTDYSDAKNIKTLVGPPDAESAELFPNDTMGINLDIDLKWSALDGAESYSLQLSNDSNFTNLLIDETDIPNDVGSIRYNFQAPNLNTKYYWRIKTFGNNCESAWSETFSFLTRYDEIQAVSPMDSLTCVSINTLFKWTKSEFSKGYEIEISEIPDFSENNTPNIEDIIHDGNDTTASYNTNISNDEVYWRVRAKDSTNFGPWSDVHVYKTTVAAPLLDLPPNDTTGLKLEVEFFWELQDGAKHFQVQVSPDPEFDSSNVEIFLEEFIGQTTTLSLSQYDTKYYWRVRVFYNGCYSDWTEPYSFTTIKGYPELIAPANNSDNVPTKYNFRWTKVPTAETYEISLSTDSNFENAFGYKGIESTNRLIGNLQKNTTYYWRVRTTDQWATSPWSNVFEFTTGIGETNTPILHLPQDQSVKVPIDETLRWYKSENAAKYHLQIFSDRHLSTIVREIDNISDTSYVLDPSLDNYTEYWWRVAAYNETVKTDFSDPFKFRTIALPPFEKPLAIRPPDGSENVSLDPTEFEWTKIKYTDIGGASDAGYYFEISDNQDFSGGDLQETYTVYSEFATLKILEPNTTYFWKVQGWNEAGIGPWSDSFTFETGDVNYVPEGDYKDFGAKIVPDPANNAAELRFNLDTPGYVNISVIDQLGNVVFEKMNYNANSGTNKVELDIKNLPSGVYLFNIQAGDNHQTGNILIAK